jgi:bacterioferritin-associated ferredoxin
MYVCLCKGLTESDVRRLAQAEMGTAEMLVDSLGLDDEECCGRCARDIHELASIAMGSFVCNSSSTHHACAGRCPSPA